MGYRTRDPDVKYVCAVCKREHGVCDVNIGLLIGNVSSIRMSDHAVL